MGIVEEVALVCIMSQIFGRWQRKNNYKDHEIGWLLLVAIEKKKSWAQDNQSPI